MWNRKTPRILFRIVKIVLCYSINLDLATTLVKQFSHMAQNWIKATFIETLFSLAQSFNLFARNKKSTNSNEFLASRSEIWDAFFHWHLQSLLKRRGEESTENWRSKYLRTGFWEAIIAQFIFRCWWLHEKFNMLNWWDVLSCWELLRFEMFWWKLFIVFRTNFIEQNVCFTILTFLFVSYLSVAHFLTINNSCSV